MANYTINTIDLKVNQISGGDYWYFIYDAEKMKLKKDIDYVEPDSSEITESKYTIFASDTEQVCINKKSELGI